MEPRAGCPVLNAKAGRPSAFRGSLKSAYYIARHIPDRVLHRRRHEKLKRRLSQQPRPRAILVVCYGNVCRSPYLQAVLQRALPDLAIRSAGFAGSDRSVPEISVTLSAKRGLDLSSHRSRPLTLTALSRADLVIVMDSQQQHQLRRLYPSQRGLIIIAGDLDPRFESSRGIVDPWNRSSEVFEASFNRLDRCAATLVRILRRMDKPNRSSPAKVLTGPQVNVSHTPVAESPQLHAPTRSDTRQTS
jgi:low molecular weight protein-tyrosine phosphatase